MVDPSGGSRRPSSRGGSLLAALNVCSVTVGCVAAWALLGTVAVYWALTITALCLLTVFVLRISEVVTLRPGTGLLAGVVATGWVGLMLAFGLAGFVWVVVLAATLPPVRGLWSRWSRPWRPRRPPPTPPRRERYVGSSAPPAARPSARSSARSSAQRRSPDPPDPDPTSAAAADLRSREALQKLDLAALCVAWHRSYFRLLEAGPVLTSVALVRHRQRILDELERRDATALGRWLASEPRACGNPLPYFQPPRTSHQAPRRGPGNGLENGLGNGFENGPGA